MKSLSLSPIAAAMIAALLLASAAHSQVAIYDYRGTSTSTGGYQSLNVTAAGTLAIDLNTYQATYIGLLRFGTGKARQTYFQEMPLVNFVTTQIYGPRNRSWTVLAKAEAPGTQYAGVVLQQDRAIGLNANVIIRTIPQRLNWIIPRTLKSSGLVISGDATYDFLAQETGTYTLNVKLTTLYNNASLGVNDLAANLRTIYTQKGIQELILPPVN